MTGLEEIEGILSDPISLEECGGNRRQYAANVLRWALRLATAAERAPGLIGAEPVNGGSGSPDTYSTGEGWR